MIRRVVLPGTGGTWRVLPVPPSGTATWTFTASDEDGVRGTVVCDFSFE